MVAVVVKEEEEAAPLHGDLLEAILSHVSLFDLVPSSHVSKAWRTAVASSMKDPARAKPWLILHLQSNRIPSVTATHAYDPHLHVWIKIPHVPIPDTCKLRASCSNNLYMLTPSRLSLSKDALNVAWDTVGAPRVWRLDPIVAMVGPHIVVAGGTCEFEDDPLAVEVLDAESGSWSTCESMPTIFKNSGSATWVSVAASDHKMYVIEKSSGDFCSFDLSKMRWESTSKLRPDPSLFFSSIAAFAHDRLILFGLTGDPDNVDGLGLWEVNCDTLEPKEIGKMPGEMLGKLKDTDLPLSSIGVASTGDFAYVYNPSDPKEIFYCNLISTAGICEWGIVANSILSDQNGLDRFVFTCSNVRMDDVKVARAAI